MHRFRFANISGAGRFSILVTSGYVLVAGLAVFLSARFVIGAFAGAESMMPILIVKGLGFVAITAVLLAGVIYRRCRALERAEHAHRTTAKDLRAVFRASPSAILSLDVAGKVTGWNRAAKGLFGYAAGEVIGRPDPTIPTGQCVAFQRLLQRVFDGEVVVSIPAKRRRKDGRIVEVNFSAAPLRDEGDRIIGAVTVNTDAGDQRRIERLRQERENFRHASRAMHEVLGVIGHELRTPLAGLRALAEFVISEPDRNTPQVDEFLRSINDEVGRCGEMVNNMLEAARLESGVAKWSWKRVALAQVCKEAMEIVRPLVRSNRIRLRHCVAPNDCSMTGDADAIRRLIMNLLSNAVKNTTEGEIAVEVREAGGPDHDWVQIQVRDTGRGISPDLAQILGRPFAANTGGVGTQYLKGAGLGLAICREIVFAHGGRITVTSSRDRGTMFTILLRADLESPVIGERTEEPIPLMAAA